MTITSHLLCFVNLEGLRIGNWDSERIREGIINRFCGSLKPLKNLTKLQVLNIESTDIDKGLEYLSDTVKKYDVILIEIMPKCLSYREN